MGPSRAFAEFLVDQEGHALRAPARIGEHDDAARGRLPACDFPRYLGDYRFVARGRSGAGARRRRGFGRLRPFDRQLYALLRRRRDDRNGAPAVLGRAVGTVEELAPADELGDRLNRTSGGGESDSLEFPGEEGESAHRAGEHGSPLVPGENVYLVEDEESDIRQHRPRRGRIQHDGQALGGGREDGRRFAEHAPPLGLARVARSGRGAQARPLRSPRAEQFPELDHRALQVSPYILSQSLQGRDIEDREPVGGQLARRDPRHGAEEGCERLARARRRQGQDMAAPGYGGPGGGLHGRRIAVPREEPFAHQGMERGERIVGRVCPRHAHAPRIRARGARRLSVARKPSMAPRW